MLANRLSLLVASAVLLGTALMASPAVHAQNRQFSFAYDQPKTSGYGVGRGDVQQEADGAEQGHAVDQPVSRRAARHRSADPAEGADRRHRLRACCRRPTPRPPSPSPACSRSTSSSATRRTPSRCWAIPSDRGDEGAVRGQDEGRAHAGARLAGPAAHVRQEGDPEGRRHQGREGARAGDGDRGHAVPGLRRAGRAHAVRRGLHLAADRRRRHGRERHQQLPASTSTTRWRRCCR